jgi:hypothetical protein
LCLCLETKLSKVTPWCMINNHSLSYTSHSFDSLYFIFIRYSWTIARPLERSLSISITETRVITLLLSGIPSAIDHATLIASHLLPTLAIPHVFIIHDITTTPPARHPHHVAGSITITGLGFTTAHHPFDIFSIASIT